MTSQNPQDNNKLVLKNKISYMNDPGGKKRRTGDEDVESKRGRTRLVAIQGVYGEVRRA